MKIKVTKKDLFDDKKTGQRKLSIWDDEEKKYYPKDENVDFTSIQIGDILEAEFTPYTSTKINPKTGVGYVSYIISKYTNFRGDPSPLHPGPNAPLAPHTNASQTPQPQIKTPQTGMTKNDWYAKEMREHKVQCLKNAAAIVSAMVQTTPAMTLDGIKTAYTEIAKKGFDFIGLKDLFEQPEYTEEPPNLEK